jgi:hypothetical protein
MSEIGKKKLKVGYTKLRVCGSLKGNCKSDDNSWDSVKFPLRLISDR